MVRHIVFWKIHKDGTEDLRFKSFIKFTEMVENLKTVIPEIVEARTGYNKIDGEYHICIESLFNSWEDLNTYSVHPDHIKVRKFMDSIKYDKTVFDYEF